jgi:hypothetical protein
MTIVVWGSGPTVQPSVEATRQHNGRPMTAAKLAEQPGVLAVLIYPIDGEKKVPYVSIQPKPGGEAWLDLMVDAVETATHAGASSVAVHVDDHPTAGNITIRCLRDQERNVACVVVIASASAFVKSLLRSMRRVMNQATQASRQ